MLFVLTLLSRPSWVRTHLLQPGTLRGASSLQSWGQPWPWADLMLEQSHFFLVMPHQTDIMLIALTFRDKYTGKWDHLSKATQTVNNSPRFEEAFRYILHRFQSPLLLGRMSCLQPLITNSWWTVGIYSISLISFVFRPGSVYSLVFRSSSLEEQILREWMLVSKKEP